jgi:cytidine deaminase
MIVDQKLIDATITFLCNRFGNEDDAIASGAYFENGAMHYGVSTDAPLASAWLCAETGAICEAQKLNLKLTASVCIYRKTVNDPIQFLSPCGICQERLIFFGKETSIGIPSKSDNTKWQEIKLIHLLPSHWHSIFEK